MENFPAKENRPRGFEEELTEFEEVVNAGARRLGKGLDLGKQVREFIVFFFESIGQKFLSKKIASGRPKSCGGSESGGAPTRGRGAQMIGRVTVWGNREADSSHSM